MILTKKIYSLLLFFLGFAQMGWAQEIQLNEDPKVAQLMASWMNANRAEPRVEGWRVQIMASTDRTQVEQGRILFRTDYPDVAANWVQEQPYYKLRVGAFRSKQEALAFIAALTGWVGAYPVKDSKIHPRDFLEQ
ncbi:MAG: SPOR domain-containing protein [Saprospiraceae bacterium]